MEVTGGRTRQHSVCVTSAKAISSTIEDGALYGQVYHGMFHGNQEYIPIESRPTEAEFRRGISRTKQKIRKKIYHEVTFTAANGERERRYFDITAIIHD
jgi:hypothetical protein